MNQGSSTPGLKIIFKLFFLDERSVAAYQVGCEKVPSNDVDSDIYDIPNYDFASDVIARAKFFKKFLFRINLAKVNETEAFCKKKSCVDWRQHTCVAGFGLSNGGQYCDYFENTKCCKSCNSTCLRAEVEKQVEDTVCEKIGGECKVEHNFRSLIRLFYVRLDFNIIFLA